MPLKYKKHTEEAKLKISKANKIALKGNKCHLGYKHSIEVRKKISDKLKGRKVVFSQQHKQKLSESAKKRVGEKSPSWKGGLSFLPYSIDWISSLRISIRERDKYTCKICGEKQGDRAHSIHHIDYDKENCNPDNLITLCNICHTKTNFKREYWKEYFNNLI